MRLGHVAYVMLCARLRSQKRSDKEIDAGHVRDIASVASYTPLKITRPPRSSKARKATWETPQSGLEITAGPRAVIERAWRSWPRLVRFSARLTARIFMQRRRVGERPLLHAYRVLAPA